MNELLKNELIEEIKEMELFGMKFDSNKLLNCKYTNGDSLWTRTSHNSKSNVKVIENLIKKCANINEKSTSNNGRTALMQAIVDANIPLINLLIKKNAYLREKDNSNTGLEYATESVISAKLQIQSQQTHCKRELKNLDRRSTRYCQHDNYENF